MLNRAMEVGLRQQLAVYDAVYITLAQKTGYPLISTDQLQQKAAINEGVVLKPITDFQP
jgi:predicted nucleic acid-binding protein